MRSAAILPSSNACLSSCQQDNMGLSLRAIGSGLLIGLLVNVSNTYYGLRVGAGSQMSMVSGLVGFAGFKMASRYTNAPLTPSENVLFISVATASGCMPLTAGLLGAITALEYLVRVDENGPLHLDLGHLLLQSIGLCFFGIIFTAALRTHLILRGRLPRPGPSAIAQLINKLHRNRPKAPLESNSAEKGGMGCQGVRDKEIEWSSGLNSLLWASIVSGILVRASLFAA